MTDMVNHPKHYTQASVPLEPIDVLRYAPFDLGNCLKYIIRAGHKDDAKQDLAKARWYLNCATETSEIAFENYCNFLSQYGLLLRKFVQFKSVSIDSLEEFFSDLEGIIWGLNGN